MSEDSLNVNRMNVKPGGKQAIMRPGWFIRNGLKFTQHMVFTGGPNKGLAKGLKAVCEEIFGAEQFEVDHSKKSMRDRGCKKIIIKLYCSKYENQFK